MERYPELLATLKHREADPANRSNAHADCRGDDVVPARVVGRREVFERDTDRILVFDLS